MSNARGVPPGLAARTLAAHLVAGVLMEARPLEQVLAQCATSSQLAALQPRDRALARAIAATVLRRQGELEHVLKAFLERPLPANKGRLWPILLTGAAQLVCLDMAPHAVVDLAVETTRRDRGARRFAKLVNAVLRRVAEHGPELIRRQDATRLNIPDWLWQRWSHSYGPELTRRLGQASLREAALDISVKAGGDSAAAWAERLGGRALPTGSIRLTHHGRIEDLPGYLEGAWWVQDAAAALVAATAGDVAGKTVADLCAAPGGKTAALAAAGAKVTAVDVSGPRLARLAQNLARLRLSADVIEADVAAWSPGRTFDVVVLDAPCTATGTIRRHPDILRLKRAQDVARMAQLQKAMLAHAATLVAPSGLVVFSTCSLEPEEGILQIASFLKERTDFERVPIVAAEIGAEPEWITSQGELRTLPCHLQLEAPELSGLDGFYVAQLRHKR
ncbi:MAG TPA: RsmB/NOP family class I SAM-dependent RNA methyltransferase [Hyphomicrobiaceae bacterium]|nr:RsmB/NOP family class I SAM-dependent RNA methyltransferase [Hyphomicrobiaceae bacterium]